MAECEQLLKGTLRDRRCALARLRTVEDELKEMNTDGESWYVKTQLIRMRREVLQNTLRGLDDERKQLDSMIVRAEKREALDDLRRLVAKDAETVRRLNGSDDARTSRRPVRDGN